MQPCLPKELVEIYSTSTLRGGRSQKVKILDLVAWYEISLTICRDPLFIGLLDFAYKDRTRVQGRHVSSLQANLNIIFLFSIWKLALFSFSSLHVDPFPSFTYPCHLNFLLQPDQIKYFLPQVLKPNSLLPVPFLLPACTDSSTSSIYPYISLKQIGINVAKY
jgi:hypothetical protein